MSEQAFSKALTANDTGASGTHQAGMHIPKTQTDLIAFLPQLEGGTKNPSAWLTCSDEAGRSWRFRYIYYNNQLHDAGGTRNEYRITHMTGFMRAVDAQPGDIMTMTGAPGSGIIHIRIDSIGKSETDDQPRRVRLAGWNRMY